MRMLENSNRERKIEFLLTDLKTGETLARSQSISSNFYGASISKLFVAATYLHHTKGAVAQPDRQLLLDMLVISNNQAWKKLHRKIPALTSKSPQESIHALTQQLGLKNTRGYLGSLRGRKGNRITAEDTAKFLRALYRRLSRRPPPTPNYAASSPTRAGSPLLPA